MPVDADLSSGHETLLAGLFPGYADDLRSTSLRTWKRTLTPEALAAIRALILGNQADDALARIEGCYDPSSPFAAQAADLKALALATRGDIAGALVPLNEMVAAGAANFYIFHRLAEYHRRLGHLEQTLLYHRRAHAEIGWPESLAHGYSFTHDLFSSSIPFWQAWFRDTITASPLQALEIGGSQGASTIWLLDKVISCRGGRLTCIDTLKGGGEHATIMRRLGKPLETLFDENVLCSGHGGLLRKLVGTSQEVLPRLWGEKFDFLHVDGAQDATFVIQDALFCWGLLREGGFLLLDELGFASADQPEQNTVRAVEFFLSVFADDLRVMDRGRQLLIQRTR